MPLDFMTHFAGLRDPRDDKNKRHALMDILFLNVAAVVSGGIAVVGALLMLNDEIQAAREVTKTSTLRMQTFRSPDFGVLGHVDTALLGDGTAIVSWLASGSGLARLQVVDEVRRLLVGQRDEPAEEDHQVGVGQALEAGGAQDAALDLDLMVPITDWRNFTFTARIVSDEGSVQVDGFDPPVTGLNGVVTIDRESVTSDSLGGTFLGRPVQIEIDGLLTENVLARLRRPDGD